MAPAVRYQQFFWKGWYSAAGECFFRKREGRGLVFFLNL